ncbi:MAG: FAD-dependent oxidoreductase [Luteitalea sp.]|nr:FAD-dependent oxidoreductase [Luteitalea sp.]
MLSCAVGLACGATDSSRAEYDLVVYGGTSAGVTAAIQAARMGKSVVLIEPGRHLGGLTSGGLGATDIGNKAAIGGIARELYRRIADYYAQDEAWVYQTRDEYESSRQSADDDTMWTFEPRVAEAVLREMIEEANVPVVYGERLDLQDGVTTDGTAITQITMEGGKTYSGRIFIDTTYEGDLLAGAGVSHFVGREANSTYNETLNGVQTESAVSHQFRFPVDPYVVSGDPTSGLLPYVHADPPGEEGAADKRVQAFNFRLCLTDVPENQIPFPKPDGYASESYELLFRYFEAGEDRIPWINTRMPNRKTDINNKEVFSSDFIGMSYDYPEADYATRERSFDAHRRYQMGLMWALANEPRVPEAIRNEVARWGLAKDEFVDTGGWPHQLYIREARRMIGDYVMSERNCRGTEVASTSVGLAAYTMDSHNVQRYVKDGKVLNEGDVQVGGFPPYPIALASIVPKADECRNLVVPVSLSASHIAFGSIRMEPVFMVLGQSAATIAAHAIDEDEAVQRIDTDALQKRLLKDGQILSWTETTTN